MPDRSMSSELVAVRSVTAEDDERWRALCARAVEPNPAFEPEAVRAAAAFDPVWSESQVLFVRDGAAIVACLPVRHVSPSRSMLVHGLSTRVDPRPVPLLPVLGTPLVEPESLEPALRCLLEALRAGRVGSRGARRPAVLTIERWNEAGPVAGAWRAACAQVGLVLHEEDRWGRPILKKPANGWPESLGAKRLADARRKRRRLAEELGAPVTIVDRAATPSEVPAAIAEYVRLEGAGWKGRAGTSLAAAPESAAAFDAACLRWAAAGRLSLYSLEAAGVTLAMRCAVRSGAGVYLLRIAYDETYARYGPGVLLELGTAEHVVAREDAAWMDACCAPTNTFYPGFLPDREQVATAITVLHPEGAAALAARPVLRRGAHAARTVRALVGARRRTQPHPATSGGHPG